MNKNKIFKIAIILFIGISILINIGLYRIITEIRTHTYYNFNVNKTKIVTNSDLAYDLVVKSCTERDSNVYMTECAIDLLDITAAQREWKQRKLEALKHPQINTYDIIQNLEEQAARIKKWRYGFEIMRDSWCNARTLFRDGSGIPREQTECKMELELLAINDLNDIYYDTIMKGVYGSQGIQDFEPSKKDLEVLTKTNKTKRGCVWAGEETDCD